MKDLVSADWLCRNLGNEELVLLDASMDMTAQGEVSALGGLTIPGARYFDLKGDFSDRNADFPNTFPTEEQFESECRKLGIKQSAKIVVFDNTGIFSSPRVWWMFRVMGHRDVAVLDGGLPEWINKGFKTEQRKKQTYQSGEFKAAAQEACVVSYAEVKKNTEDRNFLLIDARSAGRFEGREEEPRKQLKSGHIKNSVNIPYTEVLSSGKYRPIVALKKLFEAKCGRENRLVFSCGSGITACIVLLASEMAFQKSPYVYDGSWTEWAERNNLKKSF